MCSWAGETDPFNYTRMKGYRSLIRAFLFSKSNDLQCIGSVLVRGATVRSCDVVVFFWFGVVVRWPTHVKIDDLTYIAGLQPYCRLMTRVSLARILPRNPRKPATREARIQCAASADVILTPLGRLCKYRSSFSVFIHASTSLFSPSVSVSAFLRCPLCCVLRLCSTPRPVYFCPASRVGKICSHGDEGGRRLLEMKLFKLSFLFFPC